MRELVVSAGVDPRRVFRIPIGIDLERFPLVGPDHERRRGARSICRRTHSSSARSRRTASAGATGLEPKLVKGPDVLVAALARDPALERRSSSSC